MAAAAFGLGSCSGPSASSTSTTIVDPVGHVSSAELAAAVVACLREQGVSARVLADGTGVFVDTVGRDRDEVQRLQSDCETAAGADAEPVVLDDEEVRSTYDRWLDTAACLAHEGYEIPPAPSFETFLESWATGPWNPYLFVDVRPAEFERLNEICPQ